VTVCIAGMCSGLDEIVVCCDSMISTIDTSADTMALKLRPIHKNWVLMFAGEDIAHIADIEEFLNIHLDDKKPLKLSEISSIIKEAYQTVRTEVCEDTYLRSFKLSIDEFLKKGKKYFTESIFSSIFYEIDRFSLLCTILVAGFDDKGMPHIFTVINPGVVQNYDHVGFWAIGSGQNSALSSLFYSGMNIMTGPEKAVYKIYEAKLMSETALGVGKETVLTKFSKDKSVFSLKIFLENDLKELRKLWEEKGKPRFPTEANKVVENILEKETT